MGSETRFSPKALILLLAGVAAFLIYIYVFNVDIPKIISEIQRANPYFYLLAFAASILDVSFFALTWHFLLRPLSIKPSFKKTFLLVWVGLFVDLLIPAEAVSGEISKAYLMGKDHEDGIGKVVASLVAQRIIGTIITVLMLVLGALTLFVNHLLTGFVLNLMVLVIVGTVISLIVLLLFCIKEAWTLRMVDALVRFADYVTRGRWKLKTLRTEALRATRMFHKGIKTYGADVKALAPPIVFATASWMFNILTYYFVFLSLGFSQISWSVLMVVSALIIAIKAVPLGVPFEVGLPEITMSTLFFYLLVPDLKLCITATILIRILTVLARFFIGFAAQQLLGIQVITTVDTKKLLEQPSEKENR